MIKLPRKIMLNLSLLFFGAINKAPSQFIGSPITIQATKKEMKREGRQHGMVRTHITLLRPNSRVVNRFDAPPTAGIFEKVPSKPTNHSKFTGKCDRPRCADCHLLPAGKSKAKTKGTHKLRSCDVAANQRLVAWRVVDSGGREGLKFLKGSSASGMLGLLSSERFDDEVEDYDEEDDGDVGNDLVREEEEEMGSSGVEMVQIAEEEDEMGFCDLGFVMDLVDEIGGDWCLVGEMGI